MGPCGYLLLDFSSNGVRRCETRRLRDWLFVCGWVFCEHDRAGGRVGGSFLYACGGVFVAFPSLFFLFLLPFGFFNCYFGFFPFSSGFHLGFSPLFEASP